MSQCICSNCKNLTTVMGEIDSVENDVMETCEFGFPSEGCAECETGQCELSCEHYVEDCEEETFSIVQCVGCGKELKVSSTEEGAVYCPMCYLQKGL